MSVLQLTSFPARQGDALWIRWGDRDAPHALLVDMGTEAIGKAMRPRLEALAAEGGSLDLLVVTHVDADHIGGVLTSLAEADPIAGLEIGDIWFNGFEHLAGKTVSPGSTLEAMGPAQGERLSDWLRTQRWNEAFDRGPVVRDPDSDPPVRTLHDGLTLTVLGPTPERLERFVPLWKETVEEALAKGSLSPEVVSPGLEALGSDQPPVLESRADLIELATRDERADASVANGSSIALLLEYCGARVLLTGDAYSSDLVEAIGRISPAGPLPVDAFKLSHHGSKKSTSREVIEAVSCSTWLFSTDGTRFRHPDAEAVARVLAFGKRPDPLLAFNVPTRFNGWWDDDEWRARFGYAVTYGDAEEGLTLRL